MSEHAKYLSGNRAKRVTIQGNTDERGSREYNIALGQRRADAVKQMMTLLGRRQRRSRRSASVKRNRARREMSE